MREGLVYGLYRKPITLPRHLDALQVDPFIDIHQESYAPPQDLVTTVAPGRDPVHMSSNQPVVN